LYSIWPQRSFKQLSNIICSLRHYIIKSPLVGQALIAPRGTWLSHDARTCIEWYGKNPQFRRYL